MPLCNQERFFEFLRPVASGMVLYRSYRQYYNNNYIVFALGELRKIGLTYNISVAIS